MGRLEANPPTQSSDEGFPNHHDNPLSSPHEDAVNYTADNDQTRSYVPEKLPQPEAYPPPQPVQYPPPQQQPVQYPPQQQPQPVQYPPQQQPQPQPVQYPPQQQPQPQAVQFPPQQTPQSYNYAQYSNAQAYQTPPVSAQGIAVGSQYLAPTQEWSKTNGLFDCAEDPENAIITACFPCITFGQIAEVVDNGQTSCTTSGLLYCLIASFIGIPCIMSCGYRTKIRNRYGLMETPAPDWVTHFFCEWCALCQEYRELKARGLDPAIGWQGNMMRNQQMQQYTTMTPPTNQAMM